MRRVDRTQHAARVEVGHQLAVGDRDAAHDLPHPEVGHAEPIVLFTLHGEGARRIGDPVKVAELADERDGGVARGHALAQHDGRLPFDVAHGLSAGAHRPAPRVLHLAVEDRDRPSLRLQRPLRLPLRRAGGLGSAAASHHHQREEPDVVSHRGPSSQAASQTPKVRCIARFPANSTETDSYRVGGFSGID